MPRSVNKYKSIVHDGMRETRDLMKSFEESHQKYLRGLVEKSYESETHKPGFRTEWCIPLELETELDSFIGQERIKEAVEIAIIASMKSETPINHMLFIGPPGLGKSTIARKIAKILGLPYYIYNGKSVSQANEINNLIKFIRSPGLFSIIFIDEIHRISKGVAEEIYELLQDFTYHGQDVKPFTCLGATTSPGVLLKPLRERFKYVMRFHPYSIDELKKILKLQDPDLSEDVTDFLSVRANGVPRILLNHYIKAKDVAIYRGNERPDVMHCMYAMQLSGVDNAGLTEEHIAVLEYLKEVGKPIGKSTICAALNINDSELMQMIEPVLLSERLIIRVPRGREITMKGVEYLEQHLKEASNN